MTDYLKKISEDVLVGEVTEEEFIKLITAKTDAEFTERVEEVNKAREREAKG